MDGRGILALDTETALIAPGCLAPPLVCISTATGDETTLDAYADLAEEMAWYVIPGKSIVGHNVAYDFAVLGAEFPSLLPDIFRAYDEDRITDTMLRQKLIDVANGELGKRHGRSYSLADLTKRHLGFDLPKEGTWRLRYAELRDVPLEAWPEEARTYALTDAAVTLEVWRAQEANTSVLADQYRQARAAFWLHLCSCWGLTTDPEAVRIFADGVRAERERLAKVLVEAGLKRPNRVLKSGPRKGQVIEGSRDVGAARAAMMAAHTESTIPLTAKGQIALDEDACRKSGDPVLVAYAEFGSVEKRLSTDVPLVERVLIQPRFNSILETGRTSSKPNVQNLPREGGMRECFKPRPGYVYAAADYVGLELRTWAQACIKLVGGSRMAEVLNSDGDPHCMVAASILHCSYDEAVKRKKDPDGDRARQVGKVVNFGCPGGLGPTRLVHYAALSYGVELTENEARKLKDTWLETWPEARHYLNYIARITDCPNPRVEQLYSGRFRAGVTYCEAANTYFQGLGADAAKAAGWLVAKACYLQNPRRLHYTTDASPLWGSRIVNFVHDELILEVPEDTAHECLLELERLMVEGASPWLPDVPPKVEGVLMTRWSKQAKRLERDGRVIPWE